MFGKVDVQAVIRNWHQGYNTFFMLSSAKHKTFSADKRPYHFKKTTVRYKKLVYYIDVLRQTACLDIKTIKVNRFTYLFNCTKVGQASD